MVAAASGPTGSPAASSEVAVGGEGAPSSFDANATDADLSDDDAFLDGYYEDDIDDDDEDAMMSLVLKSCAKNNAVWRCRLNTSG